MEKLDGQFEIPDQTIAYCLQTPWLQSISIRDNILFSMPYEEGRYQKVLDACALLPDIETFPDGDLSLIGEK
jgi:ABC-type multidrug transport system fused ATPase/permease subunit